MRQVEEREGVYRIGAAKALLGTVRRVLPHALPSVAFDCGAFGWIGGACPAPNKSDRYVVEFLGASEFRILAYIDRYGRVFATDRPVPSPPARPPELAFARYSEQDGSNEERGSVEVHDAEGKRQVAQYACRRGRYTIFDSWYDFGPYGADLAYDDVMARAFLAFVHRPRACDAPMPTRGVDFAFSVLRGQKLLLALRSIVSAVESAEEDPVLRPPALASSLARWLIEAGLERIEARGVPDDILRLVRTARYADTFFIAADDEHPPVTRREIWALESALNRFLLMNEAFNERASFASDIDCVRWEGYLVDTAASSSLAFDLASDASSGEVGGEWATRCAVNAALERMRLPFRVEALLRCDVGEGAAAIEITVPDAGLMPTRRCSNASAAQGAPASSVDGWASATASEREAQARCYAMHVGLALALAVFESSAFLQRVDLVARPLAVEDVDRVQAPDGDPVVFRSAEVGDTPAYYQVTFTRGLFEHHELIHAARLGDPTSLFAYAGALFDLPAADPFAVVNALSSAVSRRALPESADALISGQAAEVLAAREARDLRIEVDTYRRRIGERLADGIVRAETTIEAIRLVREEQDAAEAREDARTVAACTRLMAALAEGSLDMEEQNAIVGRFLGEDRCLVALGRARTRAPQDPGSAASILIDAVAEASMIDGYADGAATVYRCFDSYAARVCYNRARATACDDCAVLADEASKMQGVGTDSTTSFVPDLASLAAADAHRRIELAPDTFYLCHLEIVRLLEHSFERTEEALRFGRRAIELAPATSAGYRQLGRAFMLVGDMENAAKTLEGGLGIAVQPDDIAMAYYQLAYVRWKAGDPQVGALCYVKSLATSPAVALQATAELHELVEETGVALPDKDSLDEKLAAAGVPIAPTAAVLDILNESAAAAADAGLFHVSRNLLALRLRYRPDDALVNVLKSLEE